MAQAATVVDMGSLARLSAGERHYVRSMKKRERSGLIRLLDRDATTRGCGTGGGPVPLRIQVLQSSLPESLKIQLFEDLPTCVSEKYLQWVRRVVSLPLGKVHVPRYARGVVSLARALDQAESVMNAAVSGHDELKNEVLKTVCQTVQGGTLGGGYSIGLEGAPGTGKTHFVRNAMARALDRPLVSFQLGGANDASYLLGQMYTYEGSKEGRLAAGLIECGISNPIFYFDELDKLSETDRGREIASVLIHLIDPTSNTAIRDRYFHGVDLDFSKCFFVFSYNDASRVNPVLLDRIKRIHIPTPTLEQRCHIIRHHMIPRVAKRLNMDVRVDDECIEYIVQRGDCRGEGMRGCERDLDTVMAQAQLRAARSGAAPFVTVRDARAWCSSPTDNATSPPPPTMMYT